MGGKKTKVGFKLCGNCNPQIEAKSIMDRIKRLVEQEDLLEIVSKEDPGLDVLIVISGCPVDCAERPQGEYDEVVVAGETINRQSCPQELISSEVLKRIKKT